jgi:hypothetical protein
VGAAFQPRSHDLIDLHGSYVSYDFKGLKTLRNAEMLKLLPLSCPPCLSCRIHAARVSLDKRITGGYGTTTRAHGLAPLRQAGRPRWPLTDFHELGSISPL